MKKFGKVLFAGLVLAAMVLASSCSMNVRSGLAGKTFQLTEDGNTIKMEFGKKDQLKIEVSVLTLTQTLEGTYNVTSKDTVDFKIEKAFMNGIDMTSEMSDMIKAFSTTLNFSLDGSTLTLYPVDHPEKKQELTRI